MAAPREHPEEPGRRRAAALPRDAAPGITVHGYQPKDAAPTREVFHAAVRRTALSHYTPTQVRAWAPDQVHPDRWSHRRAATWTIVALDAGQVAGFADLTGAGQMDMLFVHPDHARRGTATALVAHVVREARRRGLDRVEVRASRVLRPLLGRLGFTTDQDRPHHRIGDQVLANTAMHLDLHGQQTP